MTKAIQYAWLLLLLFLSSALPAYANDQEKVARSELRRIEKVANSGPASNETKIRFTAIECIPIGEAANCLGVVAQGLIIGVIARENSVIATMLTIHRPKIKNEMSIGYAINAFIVGTISGVNQKTRDGLTLIIAMCSFSGKSETKKMGKFELVSSPTGCTIAYDH